MKRDHTFILEIAAFFALIILLIIGSTEVEASDGQTYNITAVIGKDIRVMDTDPLSLHECRLLGEKLLGIIQEVDKDSNIGCFPRTGSKVSLERILLQLKLNELVDK